MTQTSSRIIRIPISVMAYDLGSGEVVDKAQSNVRSRAKAAVEKILQNHKNVRVEVKVLYSKSKESWNKFDCRTIEEYEEKLKPCLEIDLLRELKKTNMIDAKHLEKRKR